MQITHVLQFCHSIVQTLGYGDVSTMSHLSLSSPRLLFFELPLFLSTHFPRSLRSLFSLGPFILLILILILVYSNVILKQNNT